MHTLYAVGHAHYYVLPFIRAKRQTKPKKCFFFLRCNNNKGPALCTCVHIVHTRTHTHTCHCKRKRVRMYACACVWTLHVHSKRCAQLSSFRVSCTHIHTHGKNKPTTHAHNYRSLARLLTHAQIHNRKKKKLSPSVALRIVASLTVINLQQQ